MRLNVIAALRAPTIATISQKTCRHVGQPCTASIAPTKANGRAKIECSNLIISSVVRSLPARALGNARRSRWQRFTLEICAHERSSMMPGKPTRRQPWKTRCSGGPSKRVRALEFPHFEGEGFVPQRSNNGKKADGFCKIRVFLCKMACNRAEMSSFVSGKLSSGPLFSYTFPDRPSFLTSFRGARSPARLFAPPPRRFRLPCVG